MVKWHEGHKWTAELSELKPGTFRATATWSGESLALMINNSNEKNAVARKDGRSPLTIDVALSADDLHRELLTN